MRALTRTVILKYLDDAVRINGVARRTLLEDANMSVDAVGSHPLDSLTMRKREFHALMSNEIATSGKGFGERVALLRRLKAAATDPSAPLSEEDLVSVKRWGAPGALVNLVARPEISDSEALELLRDWRLRLELDRSLVLQLVRRGTHSAGTLRRIIVERNVLFGFMSPELETEVVAAAMAHPNVDASVVSAASRDFPAEALKHPLVSVETLVDLSGDARAEVRRAAGQHARLPAERLRLLQRAGSSVDLTELALPAPDLTRGEMEELWFSGRFWDQMLVAANPAADQGWFQAFARASYYDDRIPLLIAKNPSTTAATLELLVAGDQHFGEVEVVARRHPNFVERSGS